MCVEGYFSPIYACIGKQTGGKKIELRKEKMGAENFEINQILSGIKKKSLQCIFSICVSFYSSVSGMHLLRFL